MNLVEKIRKLYPSLVDSDFETVIYLRDDSDGRGIYIAAWNHPTFPRPTQEQLDAVTE